MYFSYIRANDGGVMKKIFRWSLIWCIVGIFVYIYAFCLLNKTENIPRENRVYTTAIITYTDSKLTEFKFNETGGGECIGKFYGEDKYQLPVDSKVMVVYDVTNPQVNYINIPNLYYRKHFVIYIFALFLFATGVGALISYFANKLLYTNNIKSVQGRDFRESIAYDIIGMPSLKYSTIAFILSTAFVFVEIFQMYLYGIDTETVLVTLLIGVVGFSLGMLAKKLNR